MAASLNPQRGPVSQKDNENGGPVTVVCLAGHV